MADTLHRPSRPSPPPRRTGESGPSRGLLLDGLITALKTAVLGLLLLGLPALLVWSSEARTGAAATEVLRTAGQLWLVAHTGPLQVPGGSVGLTPLGLLALPLLLLVRAGSARSGDRPATGVGDVVRLALAIAVPYAVLAGAVTQLSVTAEVRPGLLSGVLGAFGVALVGSAAGGLRPHRLWRAAWLRLPPRGRRLLRASMLASAVLLAGGALLAGVSLALHASRASELAGAGEPGVVGGLALLIASLAFVPNAAVWGASWLLGPGFAFGVGTAVGPFGHELGAVPALPLLAALPGGGVPGWAGFLALSVPLAAGVLAGRLVERAAELEETGVRRTALEAAAAGPFCGLMWLVLAWISGGSLGGERLVEIGPSPWPVALAVTGLVAVPAALTAAASRYRRDRAA